MAHLRNRFSAFSKTKTPGGAMKRVKYSSRLSAAIVACLASAGASQAQEATTTFLEEIVVTAQKRVEKLQDVPISVTVVDEKQLDNQSVYSIEDLARTSP